MDITHGNAHTPHNPLLLAATAVHRASINTPQTPGKVGLVVNASPVKVGDAWYTTVTVQLYALQGHEIAIVFPKHSWATADEMKADILAAIATLPTDTNIPPGVVGQEI